MNWSWIFSEIGFSRDCGIVLSGNGWPVSGSLIILEPKLPARCKALGTVVMVTAPPVPDCELAAELALACRELSQPAKKNVLSRKIRPPTLAPNWFCLLTPRAGLKKGRALRTV